MADRFVDTGGGGEWNGYSRGFQNYRRLVVRYRVCNCKSLHQLLKTGLSSQGEVTFIGTKHQTLRKQLREDLRACST